MVAAINNIQDLRNALPQAGEFLGSVVGWVIPDNDENLITHEDLVNLSYKFSVPRILLPNDINPKKAFTKAMGQSRKVDKNFTLDYIIKPSDSDNRFVVGIIKKEVDDSENLNFTQQGKITYDIDSDIWQCDNAEYSNILDSLKEQYQYYQKHTAEDIRCIFRQFVKKYAIRLNPEGKAYFVAKQYQGRLNDMQNMIQELSASNIVIHLPLFSTPEAQSSLNTAAVNTLEDEINTLENEIKNFLDGAKCSDTLMKKCVKIRQQRMNEIKTRIEVFSSVLTFQQKMLFEKLDGLKFLVNPGQSNIIKTEINDSETDESDDIETDSDDVGF